MTPFLGSNVSDGGDSSPRSQLQTLRNTMRTVAEASAGPNDRDGALKVLPSGNSAIVVRLGNVVVKAHSAATEASDLYARLRVVSHASLREFFAQPLRRRAEQAHGRLLTAWPAGTIVAAETPDEVDWESSAILLASLHRAPLARKIAGVLVPEAGWLPRLARAQSRLLSTENRPEKRKVLAAFATLPPFTAKAWRPGRPSFVHGDWHPGQVILIEGSPRMIDIDDVGIGDPAWDLARPAAWRLAGFLSDGAWKRFLDSYIVAGGPAIEGSDPWASLELLARAAVIQEAAKSLAQAQREERSLEDFEIELVNACGRIASMSN